MGEMKLCRPCAEAIRRQGVKLTCTSLGVNVKITCERCGYRKYGQKYSEEQHENKNT